ncbi:MAG: FtsX-like permease family protein [Clostridium sp.]|uniref:FtsX-like permease family protein n=1 Tax=Clostridium sp. TaxID=1506 RepID=UPI003D6C9102
MNPFGINYSITGNMVAPGVMLALFSAFFIFYAQNSFIKYRKKEFGLFMVLGMTIQDIQRIMFLENGLIAIVSLLTGIVSGTIFSKLFYVLIIKIIDVKGIPFSISIKSYIYTIVFFAVIYLLVIIKGVIQSFRYEIINLLKATRKQDNNFLNSPIWSVLGILLIGIACFDMIINRGAENSSLSLRSIATGFVGIYLFISNIVLLYSKVTNYFGYKIYKNLLVTTNLKHTLGQSKKILFVITLFVTMTIFMSTIGIILISDAKRIAVAYNPYDIAYAQIFDKNKIATPVLDNILSNSEAPLTSLKTIEFISKEYITILNDENLNINLGTNIKVEKGCFISLYQIVKDDGYTHDTSEISSLDIPTKDGTYTYKPKGKITKVLFSNLPIFTNTHYLILNNKDYQNVRNITKPYDVGTIKLMNFKDWRKTENVSMELKSKLETYNRENTRPYYENVNKDNLMFKPESKIKYYLDNKQSGSYLLFLCSYVGILFLLSSAVILHFKLLTEYEDEKIKYKKLYKIGITDNEVTKLILKELKVLFFLPFVLSTFVAAFYSYNLPVKQGAGLVTLTYSSIISLIYFCFQIVFYLIYKKIYIKKLIRDLEK